MLPWPPQQQHLQEVQQQVLQRRQQQQQQQLEEEEQQQQQHFRPCSPPPWLWRPSAPAPIVTAPHRLAEGAQSAWFELGGGGARYDAGGAG